MNKADLVCNVCCEMPCACELNNREAELMADKAALFDEMLAVLNRVDKERAKRPFSVLPAGCECVWCAVARIVERVNKIAEAKP